MKAKIRPITALLVLALWTCTACAPESSASVYAWQDMNCNGVPDEGEPPLEGVCLQRVDGMNAAAPSLEHCDSPVAVTDSEGHWASIVVGLPCSQIYVAARAPDGFFPTTDMVAAGCSIQFGFSKSPTCTPG